MKILITGIIFAVLSAAGSMSAQEANPTEAPAQPAPATQQGTYDNTPLYRVEVVGGEIPAINYQRKGTTTVGFEGTQLLPKAHGEARVQSLPGRTLIRATFEQLTPANSFGPEYLTYVLWAISPEGRPTNLGELLPSGNKNKAETTVTTNMQGFGLIVTAEPYFAVTMPSNLVVAQNSVLKGKTQGEIEAVNVHYSLLPRGAYAQVAGRREVLHPIKTDERKPLELYEAENAVDIARAGGADQYAPDTMQVADQALQNAQGYNRHNRDRKQTITYARKAVQTAEDARIITIRKLKAADEEAQRAAKTNAEESAARATEQAQQESAARSQAELSAQQAQEQAAAAQQQQQQAQQAAEQARQQQQQAQQSEQQAVQNAQELARQARDARERLRQQLSQILQTRETASGLIMSMPDVLFGFNKYDLKPDAKVKLARISGILLAYPDLKVQVNGYTDNIGSADYNQKLSEQRANSVRSFLESQNVPAANVTSQGYGKDNPIADNSISSGRAQNRRVELVVSGAAIGIQGGQQTGAEAIPETGSPAGNAPESEEAPTPTAEPPAAPPPPPQ